MEKELIEQINRLAQKQRGQGLTEQEKQLQQQLRQQYLDEFRANFRSMLEQIELVEKEQLQ
jgi:uncharacterized protein YnzC (UPF0291/DUF896 family)